MDGSTPEERQPHSEDEQQDTSYLLSYTRHLERQTRRLETEKQIVEGERLRLQRELNNVRSELDRLRAPPLFSGTLIELVSDDKAIVKSSTGPQLMVSVSSKIDRDLLKPNVNVALNQRSFSIVDILPQSKDPSVQAMEIEEKPVIEYSDIGGLETQIKEIREIVELPLLKPEVFEKIGIDPPKGVLLYGPPGTGKTLLAKAVAKVTNATFIRLIGSELVQKFIGEGARLVREVFEYAEERSPSILFIDELDAIGSKRLELATSGDREVQRTLMQLLASLDGFEPRGEVRVIAATNRPDILDPALLRPGRFDRLIEISEPNEEGRKEIFNIHMKNMNVDESVNLDYLVQQSNGLSGAEIKSLCIEAGMFAIRNEHEVVTDQDFVYAIDKLNNERNPSKNQIQRDVFV
ncbi:AAA family ATPase [archaeon]|nr:proteasome-activating nucleotidase [Candidatus Heimdallarchaeota archaeon]NDB29366.1 AAA family ATPase [archaeon]NDB55597.1 AAA family ATPase [archaeon]NDB79441.1 AAA family ATPase [archaeon]NDF28343.1 AAA family ATPase [archaeon]